MTPAARIAAAITLLDQWLGGQPVEQALTNWARQNRFAGSGDRAAIRDIVYDAVRRRRSFAALGGAETGRGLMIGALRAAGTEPALMFTGTGHAPAPLTEAEAGFTPPVPEGAVALDCPDWLLSQFQDSLGADHAPVLEALRDRAPVFLRVNIARTTRDDVAAQLAVEGIATRPSSLCDTALEVTENPRRVQASQAYLDGLVELQDAASQAVVAMLPLGARILDYCAGGGGKTLALAARRPGAIFAHDADPRRMRDLGARAERAGIVLRKLAGPAVVAEAPYDLVLLDVPCSGSGSWRRSPEAKWILTPERLAELAGIQRQILRDTQGLVAPGGTLAYVTCSLLRAENEAAVAGFLTENPDWTLLRERRFSPLEGGDGFYCALMTRTAQR